MLYENATTVTTRETLETVRKCHYCDNAGDFGDCTFAASSAPLLQGVLIASCSNTGSADYLSRDDRCSFVACRFVEDTRRGPLISKSIAHNMQQANSLN